MTPPEGSQVRPPTAQSSPAQAGNRDQWRSQERAWGRRGGVRGGYCEWRGSNWVRSKAIPGEHDVNTCIACWMTCEMDRCVARA